jgi:hypothetical protein
MTPALTGRCKRESCEGDKAPTSASRVRGVSGKLALLKTRDLSQHREVAVLVQNGEIVANGA